MQINISASAEMQELRAQMQWLQQRNLLLAQAVEELKSRVAELTPKEKEGADA